VIHFGGRELSDEPVLLTVLWRDGLMPGYEPPAPFWIRFDREHATFVPVERSVRIHPPPRDLGTKDHDEGGTP
jgi:hypothetical protein